MLDLVHGTPESSGRRRDDKDSDKEDTPPPARRTRGKAATKKAGKKAPTGGEVAANACQLALVKKQLDQARRQGNDAEMVRRIK